MPRLFLSYRREDSAGFAGRLADALEAVFGIGSVFRDVDDLIPGSNFAQMIAGQLRSVDVVLVMIGPRWASIAAERWAQSPDEVDYVVHEIEAGLASGRPVIPVLVGGAVMPRSADLPDRLTELSLLHAVVLHDAAWGDDVARLVAALQAYFGSGMAPRSGRRKWLAYGLFGMALASTGVIWGISRKQPPDIDGRWAASVRYEWGLTQKEHFDFRWMDGALRGSGSFLGVPRAIEEGRLDGANLSFSTRSMEVAGNDPPRELRHRYDGVIEGDTIRFSLETTGDAGRRLATDFIATRAP